MSERIIKVDPYKTYDDIIRLSGSVVFPGIDGEIGVPESRGINLYNYEFSDKLIIRPRDFEEFNLKINLSWRLDSHIGMLSGIVLDSENPEEVLALRVQVQCEKTRWCGEQKKISLGAINKRLVLNFQIPLNEVRDIVKVVGFITRETEAKASFLEVPTSSLSIVSTCKEMSIQVDEVRDIGGEYLPIGPGNIGDLAFDIHGMEDGFDLPRIIYSEDLKEYLTRDDLPAVTTSIMTGLLYFLDQYLRWTIFVCRLDYNDKRYKGIIEMFSTLCNISKEDLIAITEKGDFSSEQTKAYLDLSKKLFKGVQLHNKYKRELKSLFKLDSK